MTMAGDDRRIDPSVDPSKGGLWDILLTKANLASFAPDITRPYGEIKAAALAIKDGRISWIGPESRLPGAPETLAARVMPLGGKWVSPGLVDCHTHLVFAGSRAGEFEQRQQGASYGEIAASGGGIMATVRATRAASEAQLYQSAAARLGDMKTQGLTTVEIKSGYGLTLAAEMKMLRVAKRLSSEHVRVSASFLGAHSVPPEYTGRAEAYLDHVIDDMLPVIARENLADSVDAYCEKIAFSRDQCARLFGAAKHYGLNLRLHAEQFSDLKGALMASKMGALSADHLEYLRASDVEAFARSDTVAVLLPGAYYTLGETQLPPIKALRAAGVKMALATDCNPGTSPMTSPLTALNMGCTLFGLTPEEALAGMTVNAAKALGLEAEIGSLQIGKAADLAIWDISELAELAYWLGPNPLWARMFAGEFDFKREGG